MSCGLDRNVNQFCHPREGVVRDTENQHAKPLLSNTLLLLSQRGMVLTQDPQPLLPIYRSSPPPGPRTRLQIAPAEEASAFLIASLVFNRRPCVAEHDFPSIRLKSAPFSYPYTF
jgi:hypothetical protein